MKKVLMVLGAVFVIMAITGGAGITFLAIKGSALDKQSKQYADEAIPAIISNWDTNQIEQRASPEFKALMGDGDLDKLFGTFRRLGKLKSYNGCKGSSNMSVTSKRGKLISALYGATADFEAGPAEIQLSLIKHGDQWQIWGFRINSKVFLDQP